MEKILHLTLKKKWFDMIASSEKKEEYREIKPYWVKRLMVEVCFNYWEREFDIVRFRNGYAKNAPTMDVKCIRIFQADGRPEWGAELDKRYFVIALGELLPGPSLK